MSRIAVNRAAEMEAFVRVADLGGFSAAARDFGLTPSAISKLVSRLEARLGARLVNRSTRALQLTAEGQAFYDRAVAILSDIDQAERNAAAAASPRGHIRVNCNVPFGMRCVLPRLASFLERRPEVTIDVVLSDSVVDLVQERADVAIRTGPLQDSRLTARKLGASQMAIVAAPAYLAKHGTPSAPEDLTRHKAIGWTFARALRGWPLRVGDSVETLSAPIAVRASDGEAARLLALGGAGLARLALFHIGPDIEAGRLAPVLEDYNPREREDIHAVYLGRRGQLPARVRAFLDFLGEQAQITDDRLICDPDGTWRLRRGAVGAA